MRDDVLALLRAQLESYRATGSPEALTDAGASAALEQAIGLAMSVPPTAGNARDAIVVTDVEALRLAAWFRWHREQSLPEQRSAAHIELSILFVQLRWADPQAEVPADLRRLVEMQEMLRPPRTEQDFNEYSRAHDNLNYMISTGDLSPLPETIVVLRRPTASFPNNDPERALMLNNLGICYELRFDQKAAIADLAECTRFHRAAESSLRPGHPSAGLIRVELLRSLSREADAHGDLAVVEEAVAAGRRLVPLLTDQGNRTDGAAHLANALGRLARITGNIAELDEAIAIGQALRSAPPAGNLGRLAILHNLNNNLVARYELTNDLRDVEEATGSYRSILTAIPDGMPERVKVLSQLGVALWRRAERIGDPADLAEAIDQIERAVAQSSRKDPDLPGRLNNLASVLRLRAGNAGDLGLLTRAISTQRAALDLLPLDHPFRGTVLVNLTGLLREKYVRTDDPATLDAAMAAAEQAVAARTAPAERAGALNQLGLVLFSRFGRDSRIGDLDRARDALDEAERLATEGSDLHAAVLTNFGNVAKARFNHADDTEALELSITLYRRAVAARAEDDPRRTAVISNLGMALEARYQRTGNPDDYGEARRLLRGGADAPSAPPDKRLQAAYLIGQLGMTAGRWRDALDGYGTAIELLPLVANRGLASADQQHHLSLHRNTAADAAAAALHAGEPERAVELLEHGRGVLLAQRMEARDDFTDLQAHSPELAARLAGLRNELDNQPGALELTDEPPPSEVDRRHRLTVEWDRLLAEIRALPAFADFLRPLRFDSLRHAVAGGPAVLVNVSRYRSDALVVRSDGVTVVPLAQVDPAAVALHTGRFLDGIYQQISSPGADKREEGRQAVAEVLDWLWSHITEPVLRHLGHTSPPPATSWSRIWWCPTGLLNFLPLHAAAAKDAATTGRCVLDRVVSSYTPTLRALLEARGRVGAPDLPHRGALVVSVPEAPGLAPLPGAGEEARLVAALLPGTQLLDGAEASRDRVVAALRTHSLRLLLLLARTSWCYMFMTVWIFWAARRVLCRQLGSHADSADWGRRVRKWSICSAVRACHTQLPTGT